MDDIKKPVRPDVAQPNPIQAVELVPVAQSQPETTPTPTDRQAIADTSTLDTKTQAPVVASKDNSNLKMTIIIVLAVVVALVLIGVAYMAFMKQEVEAPAQTNDQSEPVSETEKVDAATLDQDIAEIDAIVNEINDAEDFPDGELDDSGLGL